MSNGYWFKRRRYGFGWIPVTWQGWAVLGVYLVVVIGGATTLVGVPEANQARELGFFLTFVALATVGLIRIAIWKGPRARWRWGRSPEDNPDEDF